MKVSEKVRNIVMIVEGGIGKNIACTAVIKSIKQTYPDKNIIVVAGCPEVFYYNPYIKKVFNFNNPLYFYEDFINEETIIFKSEPYLDYNYINKQSHVIQNWCDDFGIENIQPYPDLYFSETELESAQMFIKSKLVVKDKNGKEKNPRKGIVLIQWVGGRVPSDKTELELKRASSTMFRRNIPYDTVQEVTNRLIKKNYAVGIVGHENYPEIKDAEKIFFPIRSVLALLKYAHSFIGIDSFLQHASASEALRKQGIVCWGGTSPKCLGYDTNLNLTKEVCRTPYCHRPNSYLFDTLPNNMLWDCHDGEKCLKYTADEIMQVFEEQIEKKIN